MDGQLTEYRVKDTLKQLSRSLGSNVGIVAVEQTEAQNIFFSFDIEFLGYEDTELEGEPFSVLLPVGFDEEHRKRMLAFFAADDDGTVRGMREGRPVDARAKDGSTIKIRISISKYKLENTKLPNLGVAFVQQADDQNLLDSERLENVHNLLRGLLLSTPIPQAVHHVRNLWLKRVAAVGLPTALVGAITFSTQIVNGARSFLTAIAPQAPVTQVISTWANYSPITSEEERFRRLIGVRNTLQETHPEIVSVAFYTLSLDEFGQGFLRYQTDSNNVPRSRETYFENVVLTSSELQNLRIHNCFYRKEIGNFKNDPGQPKFDGIVCPTFQLAITSNGPRIQLKNAIAVSLQFSLSQIEPVATQLWQLGPQVDNPI